MPDYQYQWQRPNPDGTYEPIRGATDSTLDMTAWKNDPQAFIEHMAEQPHTTNLVVIDPLAHLVPGYLRHKYVLNHKGRKPRNRPRRVHTPRWAKIP